MEAEKQRVGLCASCSRVKRLETKIGATIYLCGMATKDPRFPKFPPLPMLACPAFEKDENVEGPDAEDDE